LPDLFARDSRLVVAFSGGQDSTCLLHALANAYRGPRLIAVHLDHALRAESAEAAERVMQLAARIGVEAHTVRVDVRSYRGRRTGWSVQQAARAARYQVLAAIAERRGGAAVLVAHTADDQAETLLLNLLRGTGLAGLAGMRIDEMMNVQLLGPPLGEAAPTARALRVARPLLRVARSTTLAYCSQFGLALVDDASNQSRAYTRNRVRLDLLPLLEQFNPAIREVLARTADLVAEDDAVLSSLVTELRSRLAQGNEWDLHAWRSQPRALQRRLLRLGLGSLVGGLIDIRDAPVEDALDLLQTGEPNQTYHLPYGVELCIGARAFFLRPDGAARTPLRGNT
jgi:tRNA(Ile)-lysidine synthase